MVGIVAFTDGVFSFFYIDEISHLSIGVYQGGIINDMFCF
jgi:hypothetical protein